MISPAELVIKSLAHELLSLASHSHSGSRSLRPPFSLRLTSSRLRTNQAGLDRRSDGGGGQPQDPENDTVRVLEATVSLHSKKCPIRIFGPLFFEQTPRSMSREDGESGGRRGFGQRFPAATDRHNLLIGLKNVVASRPQPLTCPPPTPSPSMTEYLWFLKMPTCGC
jgi:hypothetical protein